MKSLKKLTAALVASASLLTSNGLNAQCCYPCDSYDCGDCGYGYEDCCQTPCISPALAMGAIAVAAIVVVVIHNNSLSNSSSSSGGAGQGSGHSH